MNQLNRREFFRRTATMPLAVVAESLLTSCGRFLQEQPKKEPEQKSPEEVYNNFLSLTKQLDTHLKEFSKKITELTSTLNDIQNKIEESEQNSPELTEIHEQLQIVVQIINGTIKEFSNQTEAGLSAINSLLTEPTGLPPEKVKEIINWRDKNFKPKTERISSLLLNIKNAITKLLEGFENKSDDNKTHVV